MQNIISQSKQQIYNYKVKIYFDDILHSTQDVAYIDKYICINKSLTLRIYLM